MNGCTCGGRPVEIGGADHRHGCGLPDDDPCLHDSSTGDEGPCRDIPSGIVVRWRCDGCGHVHYSDDALARLQATFGALQQRYDKATGDLACALIRSAAVPRPKDQKGSSSQ